MKAHSILNRRQVNKIKEIKNGYQRKNDRMVVLACEECKERNYTTTKTKRTLRKEWN